MSNQIDAETLKLALLLHPPPGILTMQKACEEVIKNREFMDQYRRLKGCSFLLDKRSPIEKMIDTATGYAEIACDPGWDDFFDFVKDYVWWPAVVGQLEEARKAVDKL